MNTQEFKKTLFKLNKFCCANKLEYMVTGTAALYLLGLPSDFMPGDIDIKVFHVKDEQRNKLKELQFLSGLDNKEYSNNDKCYSFYIDGIKINALNSNDDYDRMRIISVVLSIFDEYIENNILIAVQKVSYALADKMKLGRNKDRVYMLNLIKNCSNL